MFQKSNYTFHTPQRPSHVSDQEEKEEKKMVKPIAPGSASGGEEDPDNGNPPCSNRNAPHGHWLPEVHFPLQPTPT